MNLPAIPVSAVLAVHMLHGAPVFLVVGIHAASSGIVGIGLIVPAAAVLHSAGQIIPPGGALVDGHLIQQKLSLLVLARLNQLADLGKLPASAPAGLIIALIAPLLFAL